MRIEGKYLFYEWNDFEKDANAIYKQYEKLSPHVIGIYRGSLPLAITLSNGFSNGMSVIRFQTRDGNDKTPKFIVDEIPEEGNILVVDDIYDTGHTMEKLREFLIETISEDRLHFVCLHENEAVSKPESLNGIVQSYHTTQGKWVVYPWE